MHAFALLLAAPLLRGLVKKMEAAFQNRQGPPVLQPYYDLWKLVQKEPVRSATASWVFAAGPRVYFATTLAATLLLPVLTVDAPLRSVGGLLAVVGLLALGRFALAVASLDTGSPFGGMGSSREMTVAALAEPALLLSVLTGALACGSFNIDALVQAKLTMGISLDPSAFMAFVALFIILIAEAGRIPVDNPATHLELTMIHEAMALEYSGPDLALVEWASSLKELLFMTLLIDLFVPIGIAARGVPADLLVALVAFIAKIGLLAVGVAVIESTNAKLRLFRVPELMATSLGLGFLALAIRFL